VWSTKQFYNVPNFNKSHSNATLPSNNKNSKFYTG
jgi:hypothetical protein